MNTEARQAELARLRAENARLLGLVDGLKEAVGYASLYHSFPDMPYEQLRTLARKMTQDLDAEKYLADLWQGLEARSVTASEQSESSKSEYAQLNNMFDMLHHLSGKVNK